MFLGHWRALNVEVIKATDWGGAVEGIEASLYAFGLDSVLARGICATILRVFKFSRGYSCDYADKKGTS